MTRASRGVGACNASPRKPSAARSSYQSQPTLATPPRQAVLIVTHGDGWLAAYAERNIDVRIVAIPYAGESVEAVRLADEYLDLILPRRYRDLYWPSKQRAMDLHGLVLPSDIVQRDWECELSRVTKGLAKQERGRKVWTI